MYKNIYVAVDNSDHSNQAAEIAVQMAKHFGASVIGSHVYAAKMHDKRFKQMEAGLPEEYHDEKELEKQRRIHDSLITRGLEIITDSYLDIIKGKCDNANIAFEGRSLEGRNFQVLAQDINENKYDLVIMGALGVGAVRESLIGSVAERVVRRVRSSDILLVKDLAPIENANRKIFVCLDGSHHSFGGLLTAIDLGKALNMEVEALSAFDPYFHYAAFNSIAGVLSEEAGKVFRFKEQEKLHEEVIDSGLAKIYQAHLDIGKQIAAQHGVTLKTTLLDGKAFERILQYCRKEKPWLVIMGRIGVHTDGEMDIGSNSENLMRMLGANILISNKTYVPPIDTLAEYTIAWTDEAKRRMEKVPVFARGVAKTAIYRYAVEKGHTIISNEVVDSAMGHLLPASSIAAMKHLGEALEEKRINRDTMVGSDEVIQDLMGGGAQMLGMMGKTVDAGAGGAILNYEQRRDLPYYMCNGCGYIAKGDQPVKCPICSAGAAEFGMIDKNIIQDAAKAEGNIEVELAYDDVPMEWTSEGKARLRQVPSGYLRRRAKAIIEKSARKRGIRTITTDFAAEVITQYAEEKDNWKDEIMANNKSAVDAARASEPAFTWDAEAITRLERVPAGYMRDSTKMTVEEHAGTLGIRMITLDVANAGIEKAKQVMEESMKNPEALQRIMDLGQRTR
ncbi:MAG TPA: universal stress protein, partial [Nitrospiria bacterium]|nr:universal stress protein [Nitrospiria bacterium]